MLVSLSLIVRSVRLGMDLIRGSLDLVWLCFVVIINLMEAVLPVQHRILSVVPASARIKDVARYTIPSKESVKQPKNTSTSRTISVFQ